MAPIGCPKKSVRNYHSTLRKFPKERRPGHLIWHVHKKEVTLQAKALVNVVLPLQVYGWRSFTCKDCVICFRWHVALQSEETAKFPHFVLSTHDSRLFVPGAKCKVDLQLSYRPVGIKPFSSHLCTPRYRITTANLLYEVRVYFWSDFPIT